MPYTARGARQDPAGNIQLADGTYHVFPCCKWEHFASRDLVHWEAVGPTNLGGGTGSMAVREDGTVIAMAMAGGGGANLHVATDRADCKGDKCLSEWKEVGAVLNSPKTASGAWLFARVGDPARPWKARDGHWCAPSFVVRWRQEVRTARMISRADGAHYRAGISLSVQA